jgi:outer membrane protein assembly factor BamD
MNLHRFIGGGLVLVLGIALTACGGGVEDDPILRLSAEESLAEGRRLMENKKYSRARPYLQHAFEVEPNSAAGREALLMVADSYFLAGGTTNLLQAESKYRDFLNRFPTSSKAPNAQFQLAKALSRQIQKPDRDQSSTQKALEAWEELLSLYPASEYAAMARGERQQVIEALAEHEWVVGSFYLRYRMPAAAARRFERLLQEYPQYSEKDRVLYHLGLAYQRTGRAEDAEKAELVFQRLKKEYPDSPYVPMIRVPEPERTGK